LGNISVDVFFVISGFLIFISLKYSKSASNYIWKRLLRLYPALFVLLLITLLIIPWVYTGKDLISEKSFWTYLPKGLSLYRVQFHINGVFEINPYPNSINGSLWSLAYEFTMYLFVLFFFFIRNKKEAFHIMILCFIITYYFNCNTPLNQQMIFQMIHLDINQFYRLSTYFISGCVLSFLNFERIKHLWIIKTASLIVLLIAIYLGDYKYVAPIVMPILVISLGLSFSKALNFIPSNLGDISYGVYIYGFLVQQVLMYFFRIGPIQLTIASIFITYILAYLSWHYIESRFLKFKNHI
jgi:peptidoglycan/LPS O-acetylase OafA/YrhL